MSKFVYENIIFVCVLAGSSSFDRKDWILRWLFWFSECELFVFRQDAFTLDVLEVPQGSGSGFVWDREGHIVTNYHVIRGASDLRLVALASFDPVFLLVSQSYTCNAFGKQLN